MSAILAALLSILSIFQGVPFPGQGAIGSHSSNNIAAVQACIAYPGAAGTVTIDIGATGNCSNGGTAANPHAGNTVFVYILPVTDIGFITSKSDTLSNTWTCAYAGSTNLTILCYSKLTTGGAADTFSLSVNASSASFAVQSEEFSGTTGVLDGSIQVNSISSSGTWNQPSITTTNAADGVLACSGTVPAASTTPTATSPFSIPFSHYAGGATGLCIFHNYTATGTYTPQITVSPNEAARGMTLAFKST